MKDDGEFTHYDGPGGTKLIRVSKVLEVVNRSGLARWRERVGTKEADRLADEAAQWGTEVHKLTAALDRLEAPDVPKRSVPMVTAYLDWRHKYVRCILHIEKTFLSMRHGFGCTIDRILVMEGDDLPAICDIKTGFVDKKEVALQLGAYAIAAAEAGVVVGRRLVLPIPRRDDTPVVKPINVNLEGAAKAFLGILEAYRFLSGDKWFIQEG